MFIILSGKISITNDGQSIAILEKGQCIGEMSLLDQQPASRSNSDGGFSAIKN